MCEKRKKPSVETKGQPKLTASNISIKLEASLYECKLFSHTRPFQSTQHSDDAKERLTDFTQCLATETWNRSHFSFTSQIPKGPCRNKGRLPNILYYSLHRYLNFAA